MIYHIFIHYIPSIHNKNYVLKKHDYIKTKLN